MVSPVASDRLGRRIRRSGDAVGALRARIDNWLANRRNDTAFVLFGTQLEILGTVFTGMLDRLNAELASIRTDTASGYAACRQIDRGTVTVRRLFQWYSGKYDQRLATGQPGLLGAADQFARACWSGAFLAADQRPPTGPLCFVDNRTDAVALRRCEVPTELRTDADDPVAEFVERLPIPVIALPEPAVREGWWLVLAAHETGHHVHRELVLEEPSRQALHNALPPELAADWTRWHREVFADLYSVLMVGEAAAWAIDELQYAPPTDLVRPTGPYPAPAVRLALISETAKSLGLPTDTPDAARTEELLAIAGLAGGVTRHLAVLPDVVAALLDLPLGAGTLRALASPDLAGTDDLLPDWARQLTEPAPVLFGLDTRQAPRVLVAAAVRRYRELTTTGRDDLVAPLHNGLLSVLAVSGVPGVLAPGALVDTAALARDLAELLVERVVSGEPA